MSNDVVVMVTVSNRVKYLNAFLKTLAEHEPGRPIHIHMQDPDGRAGEVEIPREIEVVNFLTSPEPLGCHAARIISQQDLADYSFDSYVNVDDDVLLTPHTHWQPAIDKALEPGVGFVLTNWARSISHYSKAVEKMVEKFTPQIMVYNGGGMAYSDDVAALIRELEPLPARYDDLWPLTAYVNGYRNYRYSGSLSVHQIMSKGGMSAYMRTEPRPLLAWDYVVYKQLPGAPVGTDYSIPMDTEVRLETKELHRTARAAKGWS